MAGWAANSPAGKTKADKSSVPGKNNVQACALLNSTDVQGVQGEPVKEIKPSSPPGGGMLLSQCLFRTSNSVKSVTLLLAAPDPANTAALTPRKFWQRQFHPEQPKQPGGGEEAKKSEPEEEQETPGPRAISGIGEEAYWVGDPRTGALYVLDGELYLRFSVGGVREESARLEKTKALARAALKHLPLQKH